MAWYQEEFKKPDTTRDGAENHLYSRKVHFLFSLTIFLAL
jgi:hypothetical protein